MRRALFAFAVIPSTASADLRTPDRQRHLGVEIRRPDAAADGSIRRSLSTAVFSYATHTSLRPVATSVQRVLRTRRRRRVRGSVEHQPGLARACRGSWSSQDR
jgi:hypothetical protein